MKSEKSIEANETQESTLKSALERIRRELRKWYGVISVKELVSNKALTFEIETIERLFAQQGV